MVKCCKQNTFIPSRVEAAEVEITNSHIGKNYFVNKRHKTEIFKSIKQIVVILLEGEEDSRFKAWN